MLPDIHLLYSENYGWLVGWLRRRVRCRQEAADLAQDTFVRVLKRPGSHDQVREARAWLCTIAGGLVVDRVRRQALERACMDALGHLPESRHPSPESRLQLLQTLVLIDSALDRLSPNAREAFVMSRVEGLSYPEIASRLGVCLSSVEKYMAAALHQSLRVRHGL